MILTRGGYFTVLKTVCMHLSVFTPSAETFYIPFAVQQTEETKEILPEPENIRAAARPYPVMTSRSRGKPLPSRNRLERNVFKSCFAKEFLLQYSTSISQSVLCIIRCIMQKLNTSE